MKDMTPSPNPMQDTLFQEELPVLETETSPYMESQTAKKRKMTQHGQDDTCVDDMLQLGPDHQPLPSVIRW